jgi:hypothetical protein
MNTQQETTTDKYAHLNRNGRKPGVPNRTTQTFRETVTKLLEDNSQNVGVWLGRVAEHDPGKALDLMAKLAEYAAPKLSKVEVSGDVEVTHGYAFQIERPSRAIQGEAVRVDSLPEPNHDTLEPSAQVIELQPIDK